MSASAIAQHRLGYDALAHFYSTKSLTLSPLSIGLALALLAGGAGTAFKAAFTDILGGAETYPQLASMLHEPGGPLSGGNMVAAKGPSDTDVDSPLSPTFASYAASLHAKAVISPSLPDVAEDINAWVRDQTHGVINEIVQPSQLAAAELVLVNALAFSAQWATEFDPTSTRDCQFAGAAGPRQVPMMSRPAGQILFGDEASYKAVKLPFLPSKTGQPLNFIAYLPNSGVTIPTLLATLAAAPDTSFVQRRVIIHLPRVGDGIAFEEEILPFLDTMGLPIRDSFTGFLKNGGELVVSSALHSARVEWDEKGARGAAATAAVMSRSIPRPPDEIIFNGPFVFEVVTEEGAPVFVGVYA